MNNEQEFDCEKCKDTGIVDGEPCPECGIEEQDEIQEDATSMEEKLEAIDEDEVCDFDTDY